MPIKHRNFRKKNNGITPYMIWILVGISMGYFLNYNNKRFSTFHKKGRLPINVHSNAVRLLRDKNLILCEDGLIKLTQVGFDIAYNHIKPLGIKPRNIK